jgi:hypothetical protein
VPEAISAGLSAAACIIEDGQCPVQPVPGDISCSNRVTQFVVMLSTIGVINGGFSGDLTTNHGHVMRHCCAGSNTNYNALKAVTLGIMNMLAHQPR